MSDPNLSPLMQAHQHVTDARSELRQQSQSRNEYLFKFIIWAIEDLVRHLEEQDLAAKEEDSPSLQPVSYPGGTQWAIKRNYRRLPTQYPIPVNKGLIVASVQYLTGFRSESEARDYLDKVLTPAAELDVPDSPELWPELVCADIEWKVAK